jgi:hypothetical protein
LFLSVANEYDLNPFTKEIYAFPSKGGGIVPIVSIDGWITIVQRRPEYNGVRQVEKFGEKGKIEAVTTFIYRKDQEHPTEVTEYFEECERGTDPWKKWPVRMLRHKSYIQCARYAFGLAGIYDEDEAERIIEGEVVQATGQDTTLGGKSMSRLGAAMEKVRVAGQVDEQSDEYRESVRLDAEAAQNKVNEQRRGNGVSGGFRPIQEALPKVLEQVEGKSAAAGERETSAPSAAEMGLGNSRRRSQVTRSLAIKASVGRGRSVARIPRSNEGYGDGLTLVSTSPPFRSRRIVGWTRCACPRITRRLWKGGYARTKADVPVVRLAGAKSRHRDAGSVKGPEVANTRRCKADNTGIVGENAERSELGR